MAESGQRRKTPESGYSIDEDPRKTGKDLGSRYFDVHDRAPGAYIPIDAKRMVSEADIAALARRDSVCRIVDFPLPAVRS